MFSRKSVERPLEATLEEHLAAISRRSTLRMLAIGMILLTAFAGIDAYVHPEALNILLPLRAVAVVGFAVLWVCQIRTRDRGKTALIAMAAFTIVGGSIAAMTYFLGGGSSHYYAGISLACVAAGALAVWTLRDSFVVMGSITGAFVLAALLHPAPMDVPMFVSNLAFLVSSAVVGVVCIELRLGAITRAYVSRAELAASAEIMADMAVRDPLTGMFNRRDLDRRVRTALANYRRHGVDSTLAAIDLDRFKQVNDQLGHQAGDDLLKNISACLNGLLREGDVAFRLGGDEFLILLTHTDLEAANIVVRRIHRALRAEFDKPPYAGLRIDSSIGLLGVSYEKGVCENAQQLIQQVDRLLYKAKSEGRGRIVSALSAS